MCAYAIFVLTHWRVFIHSLVYPLIPSNVDLIHLFGPKIYCPPLGIVFVILITSSSWSCDFLSPFSVPKKKYSDKLSLRQIFVVATTASGVGNDDYVFFIFAWFNYELFLFPSLKCYNPFLCVTEILTFNWTICNI